MKLSLIIPVYNAEKYLEQTLASVFAQNDYSKYQKSLEILLIDNNSTDSSAKICHKLAKSHPEVHSLSHKTPGAAAVRNFGLGHASGDYIWYIDADDLLALSAFSNLFPLFKDSPDIVCFSTDDVDEHGRMLRHREAVNTSEKSWRSRFVRYGFGPWSIIARRKFLLENQLLFPEGIIHEDMALMAAYAIHAKSAAFTPKTAYFYVQRPTSVLHQSTWNDHELDIFPALDFLLQHFKKHRVFHKYHDELEYFCLWNLLEDAARVFGKFSYRAGFRKNRQFLRKNFPNWQKNRFMKAKSPRIRLRFWLNYWALNPKLFRQK